MIIVLHKSGATPKGKEIGENKGWKGKDCPKIQCNTPSGKVRIGVSYFLDVKSWFNNMVE